MENLRFGATINPNGSLRKIHIVIGKSNKIFCKTQHQKQVFRAKYCYSYDTVPKYIPFCKRCCKKSDFKRQIWCKFYFKKKEQTDSNESDDEYVPKKKKRKRSHKKKAKPVMKKKKYSLRSEKNEVIRFETPPGKMSSSGFASIFDKPCYYCKKIPTDGICIFDSRVFHTYKYRCILNYQALLKEKFETPKDKQIYKHPYCKKLTFLQWADEFEY